MTQVWKIQYKDNGVDQYIDFENNEKPSVEAALIYIRNKRRKDAMIPQDRGSIVKTFKEGYKIELISID